MLDFIMVPAIMATIGASCYYVFELFAHRKERLMMIEKMAELTNIDSNFRVNIDFFSKDNGGVFTALRFALLFCGLGVGLLVGYYFIYTAAEGTVDRNGREIVLGASVLLFGGLSLLISFLIELYLTRKQIK
jgi:hypothetical protein